jgi:hypothetical protein
MDPLNSTAARERHEAWWSVFFNRSFIHISDSNEAVVSTQQPQQPQHQQQRQSGQTRRIDDSKAQSPQVRETDTIAGQFVRRGAYRRYEHTVGDQRALMKQASWPVRGESPGKCTVAFPNPVCVQEAQSMCDNITRCRSFALSTDWHGGAYPQLYTDGIAEAVSNKAWTFCDNVNAPTPPPTPPLPTPAPTPSLSDAFLVSRQSVLMRYMDACSSGRIGGGAAGGDYFAIKYNGGILTAEESPKEDYRGWGPGQWWQNLRSL